MEKIYLGIDVGSTGCKAVAINECKETVAVNSVRYDNTIVCTGLGSYDQPPEVLRDAAMKCIQSIVKELGSNFRVMALGVTGQMHGLVALDDKLIPLRPIISCVDFRNEKQNKEIYAKVGGKTGLLPFTNNKLVLSCTCGKILWMKENEPKQFAKIKTIVNPKDYIRTVLTGVTATDESDASGFGLYDVRNHGWNKKLLDIVGIPEKILPRVYHSDQIIGTVLPEIARELGIAEDVAVVAGSGDAIMQTVGSGAVQEGIYSVVLGSGGLISTSLRSCVENVDANLQIYSSALRNQWVAYVGLMSVGTSVDWFKNNYYQLEAKENPDGVFKLMEQEARFVKEGSHGLLFFPTLMGQRNPTDDPFAKGVMLGLSPEHSRRHMYRALLEGLTLGMKSVYEQLSQVGAPMEKIHISGGCAANDLWCQIFADVFQTQVYRVREYSACGAFGAAVLARNWKRKPHEQEEEFVNIKCDTVFEPSAEKKAVYDDLFAMYTKIYPALQPLFAEMKQFEEKY